MQNQADLPLLEPPPNGFGGAELGGSTSGCMECSGVWPGPQLDWLSTTRPAASPYVPQLGDRLVYVMRGHKDYLNQAWHEGALPAIDVVNSDGACQLEADRLPLPWDEHPDLPVSQ